MGVWLKTTDVMEACFLTSKKPYWRQWKTGLYAASCTCCTFIFTFFQFLSSSHLEDISTLQEFGSLRWGLWKHSYEIILLCRKGPQEYNQKVTGDDSRDPEDASTKWEKKGGSTNHKWSITGHEGSAAWKLVEGHDKEQGIRIPHVKIPYVGKTWEKTGRCRRWSPPLQEWEQRKKRKRWIASFLSSSTKDTIAT